MTGIRFSRLAAVALVAVVTLLTLTAAAARAASPQGRVLYTRWCERCHGVTGRGDGPDATLFTNPPRDLQDGVLAHYSTDELVRRIRSGVPLQLALDLTALRARATEVEALADYLQRLPSIDWRRVEDGQAVYLDRCELCHGPYGAPEMTLPEGARSARDLADPVLQRALSERDLATIVNHGRGGMPAVEPRVTGGELTALMSFIRLLSPGYALYDRHCAACHGDDGHGTGSFGDDSARPTVVFDPAYFRRRDPEQVRTAVWHMLATKPLAMPHFRHVLTDTEARAIVTYLKRAP
jgi:mono/diheme cytochrome c family protein